MTRLKSLSARRQGSWEAGEQKAGKIFTAEFAETAEKDPKNSSLAAPENCKRQKERKILLYRLAKREGIAA